MKQQYSLLLLLASAGVYQTHCSQASVQTNWSQAEAEFEEAQKGSLLNQVLFGTDNPDASLAVAIQKQQKLDQELIDAVADGITATTISISSDMGTCVLGKMTEEFDAATTASFIRITTALKAGANPNSIDKHGTPALFSILCGVHKLKKLSLLFEFAKTGKLNINMQDSRGNTAIDLTDLTLRIDHLKPTVRSIHRALIALGAKVKAPKKTTINTENKESENKESL